MITIPGADAIMLFILIVFMLGLIAWFAARAGRYQRLRDEICIDYIQQPTFVDNGIVFYRDTSFPIVEKYWKIVMRMEGRNPETEEITLARKTGVWPRG